MCVIRCGISSLLPSLLVPRTDRPIPTSATAATAIDIGGPARKVFRSISASSSFHRLPCSTEDGQEDTSPRVSPPERSKAVSSPPLSALPKTFQRIISPNSKFAAFALDTNNSRMNFSVFVGESRTSQPARPLPPPSPVCGGLSTSRPPCLPPSCPLVCLTNRDDSKALGPLLSRTLFHTTLYLLLKSPKCLFQFVN